MPGASVLGDGYALRQAELWVEGVWRDVERQGCGVSSLQGRQGVSVHGEGREMSSRAHARPPPIPGPGRGRVGARVRLRVGPSVLTLRLLFFLKGSFQRPLPSECPSFYHHQLGAGV